MDGWIELSATEAASIVKFYKWAWRERCEVKTCLTDSPIQHKQSICIN